MGEWRLMEELTLLRAIYLVGSGSYTVPALSDHNLKVNCQLYWLLITFYVFTFLLKLRILSTSSLTILVVCHWFSASLRLSWFLSILIMDCAWFPASMNLTWHEY